MWPKKRMRGSRSTTPCVSSMLSARGLPCEYVSLVVYADLRLGVTGQTTNRLTDTHIQNTIPLCASVPKVVMEEFVVLSLKVWHWSVRLCV